MYIEKLQIAAKIERNKPIDLPPTYSSEEEDNIDNKYNNEEIVNEIKEKPGIYIFFFLYKSF